MNDLGERIKKIRVARDMTRKELGVMMGLNNPETRVGAYENKKKTPSLETIEKIAKSLNVTKEFLLSGTLDLETYQNLSYDEILFDIYDVRMLRLILNDLLYFIRGLNDDLFVNENLKSRKVVSTIMEGYRYK